MQTIGSLLALVAVASALSPAGWPLSGVGPERRNVSPHSVSAGATASVAASRGYVSATDLVYSGKRGLLYGVSAFSNGNYLQAFSLASDAATRVWSAKVGSGFGSPNLLAAAALSPDEEVVCALEGLLQCFDAGSGRPLWNASLPGTDGQPRPVIIDDNLVVATTEGEMAAFSRKTGKLLWKVDAPSFDNQYPTAATLSPDGSVVAVCWDSGHGFNPIAQVFDAASGKQLWNMTFEIVGACDWAPMYVSEETVVFNAASAIFAVNGRSGASVWSHKGNPDFTLYGTYTQDTLLMAQVTLNGTQYYAVPDIIPGIGNNNGPAVVALFDVATGNQAAVELPNSTYSNIIVGGITALPEGGFVTAVDSVGIFCIGADMRLRWSVETGSQSQNAPIVSPSGSVYVSTKNERFLVIEIK